MPLHVERQVVGPGECPFTQVALKRPVSGVFTVVASEFVRTGKLPAAALPVTVVGFFSRVGPEMGLEMRGLGVGLGAAWVSACVARLTLAAPRSSATLLGLLGCRLGVHGQQEFDQLGRRRRGHERLVRVHLHRDLMAVHLGHGHHVLVVEGHLVLVLRHHVHG